MDRHVDLDDLVADIEACRARGCLRTYMDRQTDVVIDDVGDPVMLDMWIVSHRTAERWAAVPVTPDLVQDSVAWPAFLRHAIDRAHDTMDRLAPPPA